MPHLRHSNCLAALIGALVVLAAPSSPALADELVVDNADSAVQIRGNWSVTTTTPGFFGPNYAFRIAANGSGTVFWPFPSGALAGKYEVFARWTSGPNRATNASYQVSNSSVVASVTVNQQTGGATWQSLGAFDFEAGKNQGVKLSDLANGVVVADAIRWVGPTSPPAQQAAAAASPSPQIATPPPPSAQVPTVPPSLQVVATPPPSPQAAPTASPPPPQAAPLPVSQPQADAQMANPRFFPQTGYGIQEDAFWDFFQHRGGIRTFGYPVSNTFSLLGTRVQIFQRLVLQALPSGGVGTLNLLDEGLLPYSHINGSVFPAADPAVYASAPRPSDPDYLARIAQFVQQAAPNTFNGEPVNFAQTFLNTVKPDDAFPNGVSDSTAALLPGFDLELWGLPTSKPTYDPNNRNFIYMRFQRGIMHYDKACGCTQGLLLADYLKALIRNVGVPGDLRLDAKNSRFLGEWAPSKGLSLARPAELPGSDLTNAFRRDPSVTIDAGHGGPEIGTSHTYPDGAVLVEKALNLRVALRVTDLLKQAGYIVNTTRASDARVNTDKRDLNGDGQINLADDLQARVDTANNAGSSILVSIHFNGIADPNLKGTYVFWDPSRPFSNQSQALAQLLDAALVKAIKDAGYAPLDHGATTDTSVLGGGHYFLLSPQSADVARPSNMPSVIGEGLFLTNNDDANALRNDKVVEAIARGYVDGIKAYFARYPVS